MDAVEASVATKQDTIVRSGTCYVDAKRSDSYTEDGSISRPYKTLSAAIAARCEDADTDTVREAHWAHAQTSRHTVSGEGSVSSLLTSSNGQSADGWKIQCFLGPPPSEANLERTGGEERESC